MNETLGVDLRFRPVADGSLNDSISFLQFCIRATKTVAEQLYKKYSTGVENNTLITDVLKNTVDLLEKLEQKSHFNTYDRLKILLRYTNVTGVFLEATVCLYALDVLNKDLHNSNEIPQEIVKLINTLSTTNFQERYNDFSKLYHKFQQLVKSQVEDGLPLEYAIVDRELQYFCFLEDEEKSLRDSEREILELMPTAIDALHSSLPLSSNNLRFIKSVAILSGCAAYIGSSWMKFNFDMKIATTTFYAALPLIVCFYNDNCRHKKLLKEINEIAVLQEKLKDIEKKLEEAKHFLRDDPP